jgi:benzoate membrane transport protein
MTLESPSSPLPRGVEIVRDFSVQHAVNALVAFVFAASGPVAIILAVGTRGGLDEADLASWIFGAFFLNGLISIGFCLAYRQPLVFFWTIPGTVLVGPALGHATFPEIIGAFVATGALMLILGVSGLIRRAMAAVPLPIVMGMVAGVFLQFGLDWVAAFKQDLAIAAAMTGVFLAMSAVPALARKVPPLIAALIVGFAFAVATGSFRPEVDLAAVLATPRLHAPEFSWPVLVELVVPLAITVLVVQNG